MPSEGKHLDGATLREIGRLCAAQPDVVLAYVFGSRVAGQPGSDSDLDVGVVCRRGADRMKALARLEIALLDSLPFKADAVDLLDTSILFQHSVIRQGRNVFASSDEARVGYETRIHTLADDERYDQEVRTRLLLEKIEQGAFGGRTRTPRQPS